MSTLTIRSRHLDPTDTRGSRIRATADGRSLTVGYIYDGPDAGGVGTYAIPAAALASRITGREVLPSELVNTGHDARGYTYTLEDRPALATVLDFERDDRVELGFIIRKRGDSHVRPILEAARDALAAGRTVSVVIR